MPAPAHYVLAEDRAPHHLGGRLCLALANSVEWRRSQHPKELLTDSATLVSWTAELGLIDAASRRRLDALARSRPTAADAAYARTVVLREALFRLLSAAAQGERAATPDLDVVSAGFAEALAAQRLVAEGVRYAAVWQLPRRELDLFRLTAAISAERLLTGPELRLLKQCPGPDCGWLFVDESRNHRRRWCDTRLCGNRARVARHYRRSRGQSV